METDNINHISENLLLAVKMQQPTDALITELRNLQLSQIQNDLKVRNIVLGQKNNLWNVNADQEYHEETISEDGEDTSASQILRHVFQRLHPVAFGVAIGVVAGLSLFLATVVLVLKGGNIVGPNLSLLSQYLPEYRVTMGGSVLGLMYGQVIGFISGWFLATLRNGSLLLYMAVVDNQVRHEVLKNFHEYI